jgi:hypothetical protein
MWCDALRVAPGQGIAHYMAKLMQLAGFAIQVPNRHRRERPEELPGSVTTGLVLTQDGRDG